MSRPVLAVAFGLVAALAALLALLAGVGRTDRAAAQRHGQATRHIGSRARQIPAAHRPESASSNRALA